MGKFLNSKAPDDEQLLAKLVTHQTRGMWDAMAGRTDQVSSGAASALDSMALTSVKRGGTSSGWDGVYALLDGGGAGDADGAARLHAASARDEAARKLASNHERVLLDLTNPSAELNIDGKPLTQRLTLRRVPAAHREYADGFLIEVTRRLLGKPAASLEVALTDAHQAAAWIAASRFLDGRIQSTPEQKPGRTPDMSPVAVSAAKAVMAEMRRPRRRWPQPCHRRS